MKFNKPVCLRCGHTWFPRKEDIRICPQCKSPYWDRPRKKKDDAKVLR